MRMLQLFRKKVESPRRRPNRPRTSWKPSVDALEGRALLATVLSLTAAAPATSLVGPLPASARARDATTALNSNLDDDLDRGGGTDDAFARDDEPEVFGPDYARFKEDGPEAAPVQFKDSGGDAVIFGISDSSPNTITLQDDNHQNLWETLGTRRLRVFAPYSVALYAPA
jgi:hypothetical protein